MPGGLDDNELGRRLSAARGYARESRTAFADRIETGYRELQNWELGKFGSEKRFRTQARRREEAVRLVQGATGLPLEFFSIDLAELPAMVTAWRQLQDQGLPETARALEQDEESQLPPDPNATPSEEQEP